MYIYSMCVMFVGSGDVATVESLPITPNYLAHPPFPYSSDGQSLTAGVSASSRDRISQPVTMNNHDSASADDGQLSSCTARLFFFSFFAYKIMLFSPTFNIYIYVRW